MGKAARLKNRAGRATSAAPSTLTAERPAAARNAGAAAPPARSVRVVEVDPGYPAAWRVELANVTRQRRQLQALEQSLVMQALAAGATWSAIGAALGVSRQSAHQRYRHLQPRVVPCRGTETSS